MWTDEGMVSLEDLPISGRLRSDLRAWAEEWESLLGSTFELREKDRYRTWLELGRRYARDLQAELGPAYSVVYWHDGEKV